MPQSTAAPERGILVGGAVRDLLLGRNPSDFDWLVDDPERAAREAAAQLGGSAFVLDTERRHWRTVTEAGVGDYSPHGGDLTSNLGARDFTVNAMALSHDGKLIDPFGGAADLRRRRLRMVARANLEGDPLRLLRGVRLMTTLSLEATEDTGAALRSVAAALASGELAMPAWERVRDEIDAILATHRAGWGFAQLAELGALPLVLPELMWGRGVAQGGFHHLDVLDHAFEALYQLVEIFPDADPALRWATLLHDVGKPGSATAGEDERPRFHGHDRLGAELADAALTRLRQPSDLIVRVRELVRAHMLPLPDSERAARRFVHRRRALLPDLLKLMIADREAARGPRSSRHGRRAYRLALSRILALLDEMPPKPPLLDGRQVMTLLELAPGPQVGEALRFVREAEAVGDISDEAGAIEALRSYAQAQGWAGGRDDG